MKIFSGLLVLIVIIGIIVYHTYKKKKQKIDQQQEKIREEEENQALKIKYEEKKKELSANGLPILSGTTLKLSTGEFCHFVGEACFCKLKQQVVGYQGGSRGISLRIIKGMSFRIGNYRGHYVKENISEKTSGFIYLTSKKIIFSATINSCAIRYKDIINLNVIDDMLQIQTEKRTFLFQVDNSLDFLVILEIIIDSPEEKNDSNEIIE